MGHINFWLGDNTETAKRNTEILIDASKEADLEVNVENATHMLVSRHQNAEKLLI
jgi:hypothetical protein